MKKSMGNKSEIVNHKFVRLRRTLIDCSTMESRRDGVMMYRPGRTWLRWIPKVLTWFAWFPLKGKVLSAKNAAAYECLKALDGLKRQLGDFEYATIYLGNGSARSKFCIKVKLKGQVEQAEKYVVLKMSNTEAGKAAIRQECEALALLGKTDLRNQVPLLKGCGDLNGWGWSAQSCLPSGDSPNRLVKEHFDFLEKLKNAGLCHGDFTPWNCAIVDGSLYVYDWESAGKWEKGKDEAWFKKQLKELLNIDLDEENK